MLGQSFLAYVFLLLSMIPINAAMPKRRGLLQPVQNLSLSLNNAVVNLLEDKVRLLLQCGADPDEKDGNGLTPLHRAAYTRLAKNSKIVTLLLLFDASKDSLDPHGRRPLHLAAEMGNIHVVRWLLPDSNINAVDRYGHTALDRAYCGRQQAVALLLRLHGARSQEYGTNYPLWFQTQPRGSCLTSLSL